MEITINEYKRLIISENTLNHIIGIVKKELDLRCNVLRLSSQGFSIIKYLAIENDEIAERIEELRNKETKHIQELKNKIERENGDK